jgi:hypothetical protein
MFDSLVAKHIGYADSVAFDVSEDEHIANLKSLAFCVNLLGQLGQQTHGFAVAFALLDVVNPKHDGHSHINSFV